MLTERSAGSGFSSPMQRKTERSRSAERSTERTLTRPSSARTTPSACGMSLAWLSERRRAVPSM